MVNWHKQKTKKNFPNLQKDQQGTQRSNWEQSQKNYQLQKEEKELQHFQEMQISDNEDKKSVSSLAKKT